ncbi:MAG: hypothetical protein QOF68_2139 [Gaiellales bacterium]|jgi:hypothetical protein|nr:hypothetical protein [Gaiellales bacterium]
MYNFFSIYQATKPQRARRETEREYLLRMHRLNELEARRERRRKVVDRITRGRGRGK